MVAISRRFWKPSVDALLLRTVGWKLCHDRSYREEGILELEFEHSRVFRGI